jgi:hypothetical protein
MIGSAAEFHFPLKGRIIIPTVRQFRADPPETGILLRIAYAVHDRKKARHFDVELTRIRTQIQFEMFDRLVVLSI